MSGYKPPSSRFFLLPLSSLFIGGVASAQMGHVLNGVGPVNQGMTGAATAAPIDSSGALHWNPGSITAIEGGEFAFGFEVLMPDSEVSSSMPTMMGTMSGSTESDSGESAIPNFSFVHHLGNGPWTIGMGAYGLSGFGVDYPTSAENPLLTPPDQGGFGAVYSQFQMLQLAPTIAYQVDDNWSVGFAPTVNQAQLAITPACFESPNQDGAYADARSGAKAWGFGAQVGVFYEGDSGWNAGFSYKTEQDFETFEFNSSDSDGSYRQLELDMDFPAITSVGVGYTGIDDWIFALDLRYIDYEHTDGFDEASFADDFSVTGFGWDSIWVAAFGVEHQLSERWRVRAGYSYNENPISDNVSSYNVPAPAVIQQHVAVGASYCFSQNTCVDFAYRHGFENSVEGLIGHPTMGEVPGSSVKNSLETDSLLLGFRVSF